MLVRTRSAAARTRPDEPKIYRWVDSRKRFDAIGALNRHAEYPITLRVVRRRLPRRDGDGSGGDRWLNLVTNLPEGEFSAKWLVRTYKRRWDHEVGFRHLKKVVGMEDPRTRDFERAGMEAWGRLILYNACSLGARGALARRLRGTGHRRARDLTTAYKGMLRIIRGRTSTSPPSARATRTSSRAGATSRGGRGTSRRRGAATATEAGGSRAAAAARPTTPNTNGTRFWPRSATVCDHAQILTLPRAARAANIPGRAFPGGDAGCAAACAMPAMAIFAC